MSEEMKKELETEVKTEGSVETMEDYAAELEASYAVLDQRRDLPEDDSAEGQKWAQFAQMMEDKTVIKVKISEAVKGGVVAFVDEVRAFIPASQLSAEYVEKLEDWQGLKDYGAFVKLAEGVDGLVHISQISTQRIKHPGAVLKEGQTVKVKILSIADGKISLSMKALAEQEADREEHETFNYKETASATTGLGDLLKGLKL